MALVALTMAAITRPPAPSFAAGQEVPVIGYTLTRVLGGESWSIREASLSPDGRWIVFAEGDSRTRLNLWIVPADGGEPAPLTSGPYFDDTPIWFPSSDRIAFRSNRPPIWAIMTLPLDPLSGRPTGPARQVTLDRLSADFDISPDGKWMAYTASDGQGGSLLKVLPAIGGVARTLADGVLRPMWSPDGRSIYYVVGGERARERTLVRLFLDVGRPETVFTWPGRISVMPRGSNRNVILREALNAPGYELTNLAGRPAGRIVIPEGMSPMGISQQGGRLLGVRTEWSHTLRILPVEGGAATQLNEARAGEPLGWSPDGQRVLFESALNGESGLFYARLAGGPMRQVRLPEARSTDFTPVLSSDGNYLLYAVDEGGREASTLKVFSIDEGRSWELSRMHPFTRSESERMGPTGAGGTVRRDHEDFLYYEKRSGRYALRASPPQGPSRLLRTFGATAPRSVAVNGERIAWVEVSGGETSLWTASAGETGAHRLLARQGLFDMAVWSPDGKKIATYCFDPARATGNWNPAGRDLMVLEVNAAGEVIGKTGSYSIPAGHWWSPRWLPDGQRMLVQGMDGNVWLIPLVQGAAPVAITQDDPNGAWNFQLSPDGRYIAYPSSTQQGSTIWLLDLERSLARLF